MRRASFLFLSACVAVSCGSRTDLLGLDTTGAGASAMGGASMGGAAPIDAGPDAPSPAGPCQLVTGLAATDILAYPDRGATAATAVSLGASDIAVQTFASGGSGVVHDDIQLARFTVSQNGITPSIGSQLFGIESHGWGNLAVTPSGAELALGWHGDPGGNGRPMFRLWDVASWSPKGPVDIAPDGEAVLDLAPGKGIGSLGGGYAGDGFGVVFRNVGVGGTTVPVAAVLDASGKLLIGPHSVTGAADYPGRSPSIVWTGTTYLLATSFTTCPEGDMKCTPLSVGISRIRPPGGDLVDDSDVFYMGPIEAQPGTEVVGRAALAHHAGRTYLSWTEGAEADAGSARRILVAELTAKGLLLSGPVVIDEKAPALSRVTLRASDLGVSLTWVEDGDPNLPGQAPGRSRIITTHLSHDLGVLTSRLTLEVTGWDSYGAPVATALASPRSLVLVWSGYRESGPGYADVWAARLDCAK